MNNAVPTKQRIERALASCMTLSAGYIDGYGLLVLGTYVSFMSGNTTMAGVKAGQGALQAALIPAIAIVCFVAGSAGGNLAKHSGLRHAPRLVFLLIAALLAAVALIGDPAGFKRVDIALLSFAMGMVNPVLPKIGGESISLTFMTGTLSRIGGHLGLAFIGAPVPGAEGPWDTHLHRARMDAELWISFLAGAALSGLAISVSRDYALWPGVAVMLLLAFATSYAETLAAEKAALKVDPIAPPLNSERSSVGRKAASV
ncbi:MAG: DUF1275 domain-containing protein [Candidatus Eremiobacteraeota bacterium]|nr:DUF1275 domain-containing protein [Candidatus Eremiobacteraeota bacterium]